MLRQRDREAGIGKALRERAELDNQRKRLARDVDMARKFANERLLSELLPVLDSLDAGLAAPGTDGNALRAGLELTLKQLLKVAGDNGLTVIDPAGEAFNPDQHQAISQADAGDAAPGTVLQVFQKGYLLNDRLLRPAVLAAGSLLVASTLLIALWVPTDRAEGYLDVRDALAVAVWG